MSDRRWGPFMVRYAALITRVLEDDPNPYRWFGAGVGVGVWCGYIFWG